VAVTVFPAPTVADANAAVPVHATISPLTTPETVQLVSVAAVLPSYGLVAAVTVAVTDAAVILAVVVAVVADST
jgi:hypothetical protein